MYKRQEYLPAYYNSLPFFSGFTGENSTLVVTLTGSALWCDGRFYVQADKQLAGSEIECMHAGSAGVPTVAEYLESHFADGQTLLLDGSCVPATIAKEYIDALAKKGASLKSQDVASPIWDATGERPALPDTPCELLTPAQTGATAADRIAMVRAELQKAGAAVVIEEKDLTGEKLISTVSGLLSEPGKLAAMGRNARSLSVDDSLDRIADALMKLVKTP